MRREDALEPSREQMTELVLEKGHFTSAQEIIPLRAACGRVVSQPIYARNTLPNRPVSHMDGIAYRYADYQACGGDCRDWQEGREYQFSNTGVAIPEQYDTVTVIEDVEVSADGQLHILHAPQRQGNNVAPEGSRMHSGQLLLAANTTLTASHLGLLATGGVMEVPVYCRPKIGIIPTGDELVPADVPLQPGKNVECNSIVLSALVESWGGEAVVWPIIPDEKDYLISVTQQALESCDIVIFNAGSSKGRKDFAPEVLNAVGEVYAYEVAHGPGKHTSFTIADNGKPVLGLVGPTGGAELTAEWYLRPLIDKYLHRPTVAPQRLTVELMEETKAHVPFDFFMALTVYRRADGSYCAWPGGGPGRGPRITKDGQTTNAVLRIPGGKVFAAGEQAEVELRIPSEWLPDIALRQE